MKKGWNGGRRNRYWCGGDDLGRERWRRLFRSNSGEKNERRWSNKGWGLEIMTVGTKKKLKFDTDDWNNSIHEEGRRVKTNVARNLSLRCKMTNGNNYEVKIMTGDGDCNVQWLFKEVIRKKIKEGKKGRQKEEETGTEAKNYDYQRRGKTKTISLTTLTQENVKKKEQKAKNKTE